MGDFDTCIFSAETEFPHIGVKNPRISLSYERCVTVLHLSPWGVVAEFRNNRTNPVFRFFRASVGEIDPVSMFPITEIAERLYQSPRLFISKANGGDEAVYTR